MKKLLIPIAFVLVIMLSYFVLSDTKGQFTIGNEDPSIVADTFAVQDGASSWDSTATIDTHDASPSFQWEVDDPNPDSIESFICIGTSAGDCSLLTETSAGTNNPGDTVSYDYTGTLTLDKGTDCAAGTCSKTYHVQIRVNDGAGGEVVEQYTFDLINNVPNLPSGLTPTSTHDQTPDLSWTATDTDESGAVDSWPADTLTHYVQVGASNPGDTEYLDTSGATTDATVSNPIPWGAPGATQAVRTVQVRIWSVDDLGIASDYYDTTLDLVDNLPAFADVFIGDDLATAVRCTHPTQDCWINPKTGTYASTGIILSVNDADLDCDGLNGHAGQAILCLVDAAGALPCNPSNNADYTFSLSYAESDGENCNLTASIPEGDASSIEFFKGEGLYKLYVEASSQAGESTDTWNEEWRYTELSYVDYAAAVQLGDANIQLGQWNPGENLYDLINKGNTQLNLNWKATDAELGGFTIGCSPSSSTCWDLSEPDLDEGFELDDDVNQGESTETGLVPIDMPEDPAVTGFQPTGGLLVCTDINCLGPIDSTLETAFHIKPPEGLQPGNYETDIRFTMVVI